MNEYYKQKALIVFLKHPDAGKVKTRLANDIGDEKALMVYQELVSHTLAEAELSGAEVFLFYNRLPLPKKRHPKNRILLQQGRDLGERMNHAFEAVFQEGYAKVVIIGSDCLELTSSNIKMALQWLTSHDAVIGPAADGGYYLLGMKKNHTSLFEDISWSTDRVFDQTSEKLSALRLKFKTMEVLQDIDTLKELEQQPLLYNMVMK